MIAISARFSPVVGRSVLDPAERRLRRNYLQDLVLVGQHGKSRYPCLWCSGCLPAQHVSDPIPGLHRCEESSDPPSERHVPVTSHPLYAKFVRLTRQEEQWGLYERPEVIGTREGWLTIGWPGGAPLRPSTGKKLVKARIRQQWL